MALPLFSLWTRPEVVAAIRDLERGIASGDRSVSYPNQGAVESVPRAEAMMTLSALYHRLAVLDGTAAKSDAGGIRLIRGLPRLTY